MNTTAVPTLRIDVLPHRDGFCALCGQVAGMVEVHAAYCIGTPDTRTFSWVHPTNGPATTSLTFRAWMHQVNTVLLRRSGATVHDLPDWPSNDSWDAGDTPWDGARTALEYADFPFDFDEAEA